jgi:hypothetical protein
MAAFTAIASLAISAGSTALSFAQAGKQRQLQQKAEAEAERAMAEAKKELSINYSAGLGIQKEPYQQEREALISAGAQAIEAGREGERGAAETAGRVYALQQEGQQQIAKEMGAELTALDKATATEAANLRDARADLNLAEAEGSQLAARNAEEMGNAFTKDALAGVASTAQQGLELMPLYAQDRAAQQKAIGQMSFTPEQYQEFAAAGNGSAGSVTGSTTLQQQGVSTDTLNLLGSNANTSIDFTNLDLEAVSKMTPMQYKGFVKSLTPAQKRLLFKNKQYTSLYTP